MLNIIWAIIVVASTLCIMVLGCAEGYTELLNSGVKSAVELCLTLVGIMAFWGGFMEIAEQSGITSIFSKLLSPVIVRLFPNLKPKSPESRAISMNMTANLLGLGNAATPLGIEAMHRLKAHDGVYDTASNNMVTFVVINTASIQLIPITTAALRANYGSTAPMSILPAVLLTSLASLAVGLIVDRIFRLSK